MAEIPSTQRKMAPTVLAIGICQIIGWGVTFNLPGVIGTSVAKSFDSSLDVVLLGPTVMLTILAVISWWMAPLFERFGARPLMIAGAAVMAVGLVVISVAPTVQVYLTAWILFGIGGAASLSTAAQIALADIFGDRARQAISAMSLVSGLSNTIMWPIVSRMDNSFGWRATTAVGAAALMLIYVPLIWKVGVSRRVLPKADAKTDPVDSQRLDPVRFVLVAGVTALNGFITWGFSLTLIPLLTHKGLDNGQAVTLASSLGLISIAARSIDVIGGVTPLRSAIASTSGMFAAFVLLYFGSSLAIAVTFILLYGLAAGLMSIVRATLPLTMFPREAYARASAKLALPLNLSFAAAPPIFARMLEGPGANSALVVSIALSGAAMACLFLLTLQVRRQDGVVV
ncbi:MAG: MFS transporter [Thermomicrobiales bacterium]|nr:MFS transporter [Thermomicrobiales bacterium]MCO5228725.1 MFS transporter [Thermomicrobiales bacterium]